MDQLRQIKAFFQAHKPTCSPTPHLNNPDSYDAKIPTAQAENTDHIPHETTAKHITCDDSPFHLCSISIPNIANDNTHDQHSSAPESTCPCEALNEGSPVKIYPATQLNAKPTSTHPAPDPAIPPERILANQITIPTRFPRGVTLPHVHHQTVPS